MRFRWHATSVGIAALWIENATPPTPPFEDALQDNPTGYGGRVQYEKGSQDADGVIKIRVNGEDKFIQLYNSPGSQVY